MTKTLRVDLADLEGIPHASGASGTSVTVTAEYTSPVILEADGTIILAPKSKTMGTAGRVDFTGIYTSDSPDVREDHRGFAVRVKVAIRIPNGGTWTWARTVKPLEHMADTIRLGRMPSAEGLPPQWVTVDEILSDLTELIDGKVDADRWLTGTGSPQGVVTAPVGTRYTDTNATNGAIEWVKRTGSGTSGWAVAQGDTGLRNITALHAPHPGIDSGSRISRSGDRVEMYLAFDGSGHTSGGSLLTLPEGFRPDFSRYLPPAVYGSATTPCRATTSGNFFVYASLGSAVRLTASWRTADAWPTTLPGSPA